MMRRVFLAVGGAAIGLPLGVTVAIFTGWRPSIVLFAILFALLAVWSGDHQDGPGADDPHS